MSLQNGSDIRGVAMPGVEGEAQNLNPEIASKIAAGFVRWLSEKTNKLPQDLKIAIGRDPRLSGPELLEGLSLGIPSAVLDCGLATTPAMFMTTVFDETACDGSIMITASHLPWNRNGFKFFDKDGGLQKADISTILKYAVDPDTVIAAGSLKRFDVMSIYAAHLRNVIRKGLGDEEKPLANLKICVDAGNGGGGFFATEVLEPLGADVSSSQFLEPDGHFPNHQPNPENSEAMDSICQKVKASNVDLGLIFDTDVDRSAAVDGKGGEIARNNIVALAATLVADKHPGTTVVTDSITSTHLTDFIENSLGMRHFRFKRGYKNVINKSIELNAAGEESWLAIETSGHAAMRENFFLDDGAYLATQIVVKAELLRREGSAIDKLLAPLVQPAESREVRMKILCEDFGPFGDRLLEDFGDWAMASGLTLVQPNYEGVRIDFGDGWCLLRKSLHDPIMPLNIESDVEGGVKKIADALRSFLSKYEELDISKL